MHKKNDFPFAIQNPEDIPHLQLTAVQAFSANLARAIGAAVSASALHLDAWFLAHFSSLWTRLDRPELSCLNSVFLTAPNWPTLDNFCRVFLQAVADCSIKWRTNRTDTSTAQADSSEYKF